MAEQLIISVGREFGSGGREIAGILAEHYNIPLLDHNLLDEIASERNLDAKELNGLDEKKRNLLLSRTVKGFNNSPEQNISQLQFSYLQEKANSGESFVVVGRCSETVLRGNKALISIFIEADMDQKIKRIEERYQLSTHEAKKKIAEKDAKRKQYHNSFCEGKWGDARNYDITVNSSRLGVADTAKLLINYVDMCRTRKA